MKKIEVDNHKLMYHPERVTEWKEKGDCFPIYVEIGPTNRCNHNCIFCALDWMEKGIQEINKSVMLSVLKDMAFHKIKSVMFAGEGEPLLHKDIGTFVQEAKKYGLDVSITTNGTQFTQEKIEQCLPYLSWIRFSMDAGISETYAKVHKTNPRDFERVITNIENAVKFRDENKLGATIGVQFLMIPYNLNEADKLARILKDIGADNLQVKPYSHHPSSLNDFSIPVEMYNRVEEQLKKFNTDTFQVKFRRRTLERIQEGINYPMCYGLPFFALVDSAANIIPCNLFYNNEEFTYGNLCKQSFSEIWKGEKRKEILKKLEKKGISECRIGCRLDADNRYLHRLKNPEPHDNFI